MEFADALVQVITSTNRLSTPLLLSRLALHHQAVGAVQALLGAVVVEYVPHVPTLCVGGGLTLVGSPQNAPGLAVGHLVLRGGE